MISPLPSHALCSIIISLPACFFVPHCRNLLCSSTPYLSRFSNSTLNCLILSGMLYFSLHYNIILLLCHIFIAGAVDVAHNTTMTLICHGRLPYYPVWYLNGSLVLPGPSYEIVHYPSTGDLIGILVIDGNRTCGMLDLRCTVESQTIYTRLSIEGL